MQLVRVDSRDINIVALPKQKGGSSTQHKGMIARTLGLSPGLRVAVVDNQVVVRPETLKQAPDRVVWCRGKGAVDVCKLQERRGVSCCLWRGPVGRAREGEADKDGELKPAVEDNSCPSPIGHKREPTCGTTQPHQGYTIASTDGHHGSRKDQHWTPPMGRGLNSGVDEHAGPLARARITTFPHSSSPLILPSKHTHQRIARLDPQLSPQEHNDRLELVSRRDLEDVVLHDGCRADGLEAHDDCVEWKSTVSFRTKTQIVKLARGRTGGRKLGGGGG